VGGDDEDALGVSGVVAGIVIRIVDVLTACFFGLVVRGGRVEVDEVVDVLTSSIDSGG
jgi:hypothetical protein